MREFDPRFCHYFFFSLLFFFDFLTIIAHMQLSRLLCVREQGSFFFFFFFKNKEKLKRTRKRMKWGW